MTNVTGMKALGAQAHARHSASPSRPAPEGLRVDSPLRPARVDGGEAEWRAMLRAALDNWPLPLSGDVNPLVDQAARRHESWFARHRLGDPCEPADPLVMLQAPRVAGLAYPRASLPALALAADWTAWFFHFDDYLDETPLGTAEHRARQTVGFMRDALGPGPGDLVPEDRSLRRTRRALADLMARTRDVMADWQVRMFIFHLESYFEALVTEAVNREHDAIPGVKSYIALRRDTGPALPLLDLVEHAEGIRLPRSFHGSPLYVRLMDAAADIAGWINDVFSAPKEQSRGDFHNLVLVIAHAQGISLCEAARLAIDKICERAQQMDGAPAAVDEWAEQAGLSEVERIAMRLWIRGLRDFQHHADWYVQHARYAVSQLYVVSQLYAVR